MNLPRVPFRGRMVDARRVERLPSGYWRADLPSGLVCVYSTDPRSNPYAVQVSGA